MNFYSLEEFGKIVAENEQLKQELAATKNFREVLTIARQFGYHLHPQELNHFIPSYPSDFPHKVATEAQLKRWWQFAWENLDLELLKWVEKQRNIQQKINRYSPRIVNQKYQKLFALLKNIVTLEIMIGNFLVILVFLLLVIG